MRDQWLVMHLQTYQRQQSASAPANSLWSTTTVIANYDRKQAERQAWLAFGRDAFYIKISWP